MRSRHCRPWRCSCPSCLLLPARARAQADDPSRLVGAMLGDTPMVADLETLADQLRWPADRLARQPAARSTGRWNGSGKRASTVRMEPFQMPGLWLERSARATVKGVGVAFRPRDSRAAVLDRDSDERA